MTIDNMIDTSAEQRQVADLETPDAALVSVRDWEAALRVGQVITNGVTDGFGHQYIYVGETNNDSSATWLVSYREGFASFLSYDANLDDWEVVLEDGEALLVDEFHIAAAKQMVLTVNRHQAETERLKSEVAVANSIGEEHSQRLVDMQSDWDHLNDQLSEFAIGKSYCPEYEQIIENWNEEFKVMQLVGREYEYAVPVQITVVLQGNVRASARQNGNGIDTNQIREVVDQFGQDEFLEKAGLNNISSSNNYSIEAVSWDVDPYSISRVR